MRSIERLGEDLKATLGPDSVREHCSLARYTTLHVGGPADLLAVAGRAADLVRIAALASRHSVPFRVLGSGANILVSEHGVRGLVVVNRARSIRFQGEGVTAESGSVLAQLARRSVQAGLAGMEWAVGIPGTVGGAVVGNAGAFGGSVADSLESAAILEPDGTEASWPAERFAYGYRTSVLKVCAQGGGPLAIVLAATFRLRTADRTVLEERVAANLARRAATQPAGASCGSVFKNPPGDSAGRLIEAAGLKGFRSGGAQISPVHANFIVNVDRASPASIKALISQAEERVWSLFGVRLELEIELVGSW